MKFKPYINTARNRLFKMQKALSDLKGLKSTAKIMFLRNVFSTDVTTTDDVFHQKLLDTINDCETVITVTNYDTLPTEFTAMENWPKKTNLLCWNCSLAFSTTPVFIPQNIHTNGPNSHMTCLGNFCSFPCAMSYIDLHYSSIDVWTYRNLLYRLYYRFYGIQVSSIPIAPSKYSMIQYGGSVSATEYQNQLLKLKDSIVNI